MCHLDHHRKFPAQIIGCVIWILKSLEAAKITNESNQHPIIKYGETRMWARVHKGNRETYYVWSRKTWWCHRLENYGESRVWISIYKALRVDTYTCWRRSNKYGETVLGDQKEEHEIDFRVPGLSHAVVKEAEHLRVQELSKKIENHPHREALHADLQQNNVYNPFSKKIEGDDPRIG